MSPIIEANNVSRTYAGHGGLFRPKSYVRAVEDVSLSVEQGETLAVIGESGSGKSTLGQVLLGLAPASAGDVRFRDAALSPAGSRQWREQRAEMQLIYQDPLAALDPRLTIAEQIREPLDIHQIGTPEERAQRVDEVARDVGLQPVHLSRRPHELSGGQRQRAVIARAMASKPVLLVCDEPVSALDVSIQAQVINTFRRLQRMSGVAMVFISHDLKVVRNIAHRVAVMYLGRIVEEAPADVIFANPQHPYTKALVSSVPIPGKPLGDRVILQGEPPNPAARPSGCAFHPRCPVAVAQCRTSVPELHSNAEHRRVACHLVAEVRGAAA
ncbi:peptide ABC transporter ATP-binding protein [Devosia epidermidihirudinis]|uniref:Peptide ABC transporter ATP-binding protein n=1 Tax=Devosia epidermidihirudinis TaxID=1293439 RepID=A0A0F5Q8K0_9HYPH|nr:ABC transporter ATP-binding protein [Devosia epidermidihirudinis]KKC37302.1 peptide ABC transporter ATP-binding protein [Devosia epidermidihirudinis]